VDEDDISVQNFCAVYASCINLCEKTNYTSREENCYLNSITKYETIFGQNCYSPNWVDILKVKYIYLQGMKVLARNVNNINFGAW
jgi:hypothetical protein